MVAEALRRRGHHVTPAVWSEPHSVMAADAVVIRSCWDYHLRVDDFLGWIDALGVPLMNDAALIRWNVRKTYLLDLAESVPVVPTRHVAGGVVGDEVFASLAADRLVVKPVVGASAHSTRVITRGDKAPLFDSLVQPFLDEIKSGEWSVILFDGSFSHAILKRPADGDFRVQRELGGTAVLADAPPAVLQLSRAVMETLPAVPVFARVDIIVSARGPMLMELELIEPELFTTLAPASIPLFCDAIERRLP